MSGPLDNMSSLAAANSEANLQQKLHSAELWRRLHLFRLAVMSSSSGESTADGMEKRRKLVLGLLKDVELRVIFVAVDFCHGPAGDETKQGVVEVALLSVLESSVGQELLQEVSTIGTYAECCPPRVLCRSTSALSLCTHCLLRLRLGLSSSWPGAVSLCAELVGSRTASGRSKYEFHRTRPPLQVCGGMRRAPPEIRQHSLSLCRAKEIFDIYRGEISAAMRYHYRWDVQ